MYLVGTELLDQSLRSRIVYLRLRIPSIGLEGKPQHLQTVHIFNFGQLLGHSQLQLTNNLDIRKSLQVSTMDKEPEPKIKQKIQQQEQKNCV